MTNKKLAEETRLNALVASWDAKKIASFQDDFLNWYQKERRLLPWRELSDPYSIWVSEIMLQQTQVATVIPYFYRFMEWFPTIKALAEAPEERLLKAWEGLGYYSRVRNMQSGAQQIINDFGGEMPKSIAEISQLKGIGPYTAGAIGSIAFNLVEPAIDGNVMRVFSRLFCLEDDIAKPASRKTFDFVVRKLISSTDPSSFNQAIMDLGSGICTPTSPKCESCPLQKYCQAFAEKRMTEYPVKTKKVKSRPVYYIAQVIENELGEIVINQRASTGLLANLWTVPLVEVSQTEYQQLHKSWQQATTESETQLHLDLVAETSGDLSQWTKEHANESEIVWQKQPLGEITHVFSHLKWHVLVSYGRVKEQQALSLASNQRWVYPDKFTDYPFPKPQQKIIELLINKGYLEMENGASR